MKKESRKNVKIIFLITQIAVVMMISIAIGALIGYYLGKALKAEFVILFGIALGAGAGFNSVYDLVKVYLKDEQREAPKELTEAEKKRAEAEAAFKEWRDARDDEDEEDGEKF